MTDLLVSICARCKCRSEVGTAWSACDQCGETVCPQCAQDVSKSSHGRISTVCHQCRALVAEVGPTIREGQFVVRKYGRVIGFVLHVTPKGRQDFWSAQMGTTQTSGARSQDEAVAWLVERS